MKILDGKLNLEDYRAVLIKDEDGKVVGISFPIDGFYDLVEDIEDYSYLEGYDPDADGTVPHELVEATILDGKNLICAWRKYKRLSQTEAAAKMEISQPAYSQMERY